MTSSTSNGISAELKAKLWTAADKLRGHMDAAEYKHVVLGLIFLKFISDSFETLHTVLRETPYADPEDANEYVAERIFWVPQDARWPAIQAAAKSPDIGQKIDAAMTAIEHDNVSLKGVLPIIYGKADLDKQRLGELVDLIGTITLGDAASKARDLLGQVYEYFLGQFAAAEAKQAGQFYTPASVVQLLVEMLEPFRGRIYDPCCGSGGMFVWSEKFIDAHGGQIDQVSIYGQESNPTTWRLARMNLAIRRIDHNLGARNADSFRNDLHRDLRADFVLANPPFNMKEWIWGGYESDPRWQYGVPPEGNANFAWVQHMIHHLSAGGRAGFVLSNGSMSSSTSGEGAIRQKLVEADLVECMVALPPQLFFNTQIPACLWFLSKNKRPERRGQTLFIDARGLGTMISRTLRDIPADEMARVAGTYHAWRTGEGDYADVAGFCKSATADEIASHGFVLTPGRYVGAADVEDDDEPFAEKMARLTAELRDQFAESTRLEVIISENLARFEYD